MSERTAQRTRRVWLVAPLATVLLMTGLAYSQHSRQVPVDAERFHQALHEQSQDMPYLIGEWYGRDAEVPAAAQSVLQPNILISRNYENLRTRQTAQFVLVQSRDARDMANHYPPVCFRAAGWKIESQEARDWQLQGQRVPVTEYGFLEEAFDRSRRLVVVNFMVVPEVGWSRDMGPIYAHAADPSHRHYGAAQVQLIFEADVPLEQREAIFQVFVRENLDLLKQVAAGAT